MTSFTAAYLHNTLPPLPIGRRRTHLMDKNATGPATKPPGGGKNVAIRERNIESVFATVSSGTAEILSIADQTGLSITTVQKALIALEGRGRVMRIIKNPRHQFVTEPQQKKVVSDEY